MGSRLLFLVLGAMLISSPAAAGTYGWGTVAAPTRVAGTDLTGVVSIQALPGANGTVQQSLDILVNNAGLTRDMLALRLKDEDWQG